MTNDQFEFPNVRNVIPFPKRRRSPRPTLEMREKMRWLYKNGMVQHDIAAHFGVNQGRVSEAVNSVS